MQHEFFLSTNVIPHGFMYPLSYKQLVEGELPNLDPWHFFHNYLEFHFHGLKQRYPKRSIIPFARRGDNDDVACFDASEPTDNPKVIIIHDWASEGWENHGEFPCFLDWLAFVKEISKEWHLDNDE